MLLWTSLLDLFPKTKQTLYKWMYQYLARYTYEDWTFMNYGYCDPLLTTYPCNRPEGLCIDLYRKVVSSTNLRNKLILEVGCGRGGGIAYINRHYAAGWSTGMDLSQRAVDFCRQRYSDYSSLHLNFMQGDALAIPYRDSIYDVVLNVESSHCYRSRELFFIEVYRVLKRGGFFCYADLHEDGEREEINSWLRGVGFKVAETEDITDGVLKAMEIDSSRKLIMIKDKAPWYLQKAVGSFAGVKGSRAYRSFVTRARRYTRWILKKE